MVHFHSNGHNTVNIAMLQTAIEKNGMFNLKIKKYIIQNNSNIQNHFLSDTYTSTKKNIYTKIVDIIKHNNYKQTFLINQNSIIQTYMENNNNIKKNKKSLQILETKKIKKIIQSKTLKKCCD